MHWLSRIYVQPLSRIRTWILLLLGIWVVGRLLFGQKRWWRFANGGALAVALYGVLRFTVLHRGAADFGPAILLPFYSLTEAQTQPEKYREMLMNVFLFVPFGLVLPNVLDAAKRIKFPVLATMLIAFALSAGIEFCQYYFQIGRCEVDDVMMNALGAAIGVSAYMIGSQVRKLLFKKG